VNLSINQSNVRGSWSFVVDYGQAGRKGRPEDHHVLNIGRPPGQLCELPVWSLKLELCEPAGQSEHGRGRLDVGCGIWVG